MRTIGVTGGVGSGKSVVLAMMKERCDAELIQADEVAHELMKPGGASFLQVAARFGPGILTNAGEMDKDKLAEIIFGHEQERLAVNAIIHPLVKQEIQYRIKCSDKKLVVVEAALLLEEHYDTFLDEIWYVYAPRKERIMRLMKGRSYSRKKAEDIMASQKSDEEFRRLCDFIIDNSQGYDYTYEQVFSRLEILRERGYNEK